MSNVIVLSEADLMDGWSGGEERVHGVFLPDYSHFIGSANIEASISFEYVILTSASAPSGVPTLRLRRGGTGPHRYWDQVFSAATHGAVVLSKDMSDGINSGSNTPVGFHQTTLTYPNPGTIEPIAVTISGVNALFPDFENAFITGLTLTLRGV